jgi:hypothetical protein
VRGARVTGAAEFRERAGPLLEEDELRHTVPLGVLSTLERDRGRYAEHHLWLVEDAGAVVACAMMTPPFHLLVAGRRQAALEELVATVRGDGVPVPGVNGVVPEAEEFAACWARATGATTRRAMSLRMYSTTSVTPVQATAGWMRAAGKWDRSLLDEWARAFAYETGLQEGPSEIARSIAARIGADPGIAVWEVGGTPVTMAGASVSSPGIARVGPVYTPPEHRRRGYATSLVAAWTDELLSRGIHRCALFTDLANPTSNSIYQAVGYRPIADAVQIDFV